MPTELYQCQNCKKLFIVTDGKNPKCNHDMSYETKLTTVNYKVGDIGI